MKNLFLLTGLPMLLFYGVNSKSGGAQLSRKQLHGAPADTLSYVYKTAKERAPDCGNRPDSTCTVARVVFPVFTGQQLLNDSVQHRLFVLFNFGQKKTGTIRELTHSVIKAYLGDTELVKDRGSYVLDASTKVVRQGASLLVCEIDGYMYSGGAHGSTQTNFMNWDTKNQKTITLKDILIPGYSAQLNRVAEKIFRKDEKLSDNASLADDYFFENGKFSLNHNFMITSAGLKFLYNEYEIKSYAQGQTELFIPYSQIRSLLRPNTVISQFIK